MLHNVDKKFPWVIGKRVLEVFLFHGNNGGSFFPLPGDAISEGSRTPNRRRTRPNYVNTCDVQVFLHCIS